MASGLHPEQETGAQNRPAAQRRGTVDCPAGRLSVQEGRW